MADSGRRAAGEGEPAEWAAYQLLPAPESFTPVPGDVFELTDASHIRLATDDAEVSAVAERFAAWLRVSTGFALPVGTEAGENDIELALDGAAELGDEGYTLRADSGGVRVGATTAEGVYRGLTSLRQMLPAESESSTGVDVPWTVPGAAIVDRPRFEYRGTMLDVARHFFSVDDVMRYIDLAALHKINYLHLHLTDDQGWRVTVPTWPLLTEVGGASDVEGGEGGFYTEDEFARIVAYAAEHYMEIVPEIDLPGHTTAALHSYAELNCDGAAPPPNTQIGIGEVSLCVGSDITYEFLADVFDSVVAQSPGEFVHIGGDEAIATTDEDYLAFVPRAAATVTERDRRVIVWHEAAQTALPPGAVVQCWGLGDPETTDRARQAVAQGLQVLLSPANRAYLDIQYDSDTPYGLDWAGKVPVSLSYDWDPGTLVEGVPEESILGVEAPVWTERIPDRAALEFMTFPRLAGVAEIGWSPASELSWNDYRLRVAAQGSRWDALGVNYFRSPEVPWTTDGGSTTG